MTCRSLSPVTVPSLQMHNTAYTFSDLNRSFTAVFPGSNFSCSQHTRFLGLSRCVFVPKFSVSNYLSFLFCLFQIGSYFPFRHFPCLVLSFFLDRIQNLCFPSRSIRYGFEQSRLISQARGFITWLEFEFFISAEEAQYNLARNVQT